MVLRTICRDRTLCFGWKTVWKGKSIKVVNDQWRTPTLAEDLAMGCWLAAQKRHRHFQYFGMKWWHLWYRHPHCPVFKVDESLITQTDSTNLNNLPPARWKRGFNISKAKLQKTLNYEPHSLKRGWCWLNSNWKINGCFNCLKFL